MARNPNMAEPTATQPVAEQQTSQLPTQSGPPFGGSTVSSALDYAVQQEENRRAQQNNNQQNNNQQDNNQQDYSDFYGTDYPVDAYGNPYVSNTDEADGKHHHTTHSPRDRTTGTSPGDPGMNLNGPVELDGTDSTTSTDGKDITEKDDGGDKPLYDPYGKPSGSSGSAGSSSSLEALLSAYAELSGLKGTGKALPELPEATLEKLSHVDTTELEAMLKQLYDAKQKQAEGQINYGVEQGVNELQRALEDAAPQFQTQRDQIAADEAQALDNQALYAEARGDRGGIGAAQYASIQNTAATNQRAVNDAQVKLGTDTARQIADLRAQGEFQKADQLLTIAQSQLSQLMQLKQWAMETNMSVDQFNSQLQQWADEFALKREQILADLDLSQAQLTGAFADGTQTMASLKQLNDSLSTSGYALLQAGIMPSRQQLEAMGLTEVQAKAYLNKG